MDVAEEERDKPVTREEAGIPAEDPAAQLDLRAASEVAQVGGAADHDDFGHQELLDPIHQFIRLSEREIQVVDHPAFQRLFRIQQLGQTSLVYRGATHNRGLHSLGTLHTVTLLMDAIDNRARAASSQRHEWELGPVLTAEERGFTRLAALLHDIGHIAVGHTLEDELGLLANHDADARLDLVLKEKWWGGKDVEEPGNPVKFTLEDLLNRLYEEPAKRVALRLKGQPYLKPSEILKHLVSKTHLGTEPQEYESNEFRIGVVRDLVGNTLCADLLDYIHRDWHFIGKPRHFDQRILHYTEIRQKVHRANGDVPQWTEHAVVVNLSSDKRGRYRSDAVTAIVDLLESRYLLWEIALLHRTKTAAAAMVERAISELVSELNYFDASSVARTGISDALLGCLLEASDFDVYRILGAEIDNTAIAKLDGFERSSASKELLWRLSQRRLYKQVTTITTQDAGSAGAAKRVASIYAPSSAVLDGRDVTEDDRLLAARRRLETLRQLEREFGLVRGSLAMYCTPYGMGQKLAEIRVVHNEDVSTLTDIDDEDKITGGHLEAQMLRFCVASDFARQVLSFFKQHRSRLAVSAQEAADDRSAGPETEEDAHSRAEVRLVGADADRADHPGRSGCGGGRGPLGDLAAARCGARRRDRGVGCVEAWAAPSEQSRGVGGGCVARRGGAARAHGGRAGRGAGGAAGKNGLGMSGPVPARVDGAAKAVLLGLIDDAIAAGWTHGRACAVLGLDRRRAWRWQRRRAAGTLDDARPGGRPIHGLLGWERDEIVKLFDEWGDVDRSHRKLAHRGSYLGRVWVSPSTVDRVLAGHGLVLAGVPRAKRAPKTPWPDWCEWRPNQLWCWDGTQFPRCPAAKHAYAIVDVVSRKWIATHLTSTPDSVAARVLFAEALQGEGLLSDEIAARLADPDAELPDSDDIPLLLALSDNGPEMRAGDTARFMAMCSIVQHFGRPSTPTDQAWIESLFGHIKHEHPHLGTLDRPADLARELERVRAHYNEVRLHEGIGYVTPQDEHQGRGEHIRQARRDGLQRADARRRAWHRHRPLP